MGVSTEDSYDWVTVLAVTEQANFWAAVIGIVAEDFPLPHPAILFDHIHLFSVVMMLPYTTCN